MIAVENYNLESNHSKPSVQTDPWHALQQQGATEQALNDLLGYLEDDLKMETPVSGFSCLSEE
jgi:regulator of sirC expression with transglutaminase-like and TPR domain